MENVCGTERAVLHKNTNGLVPIVCNEQKCPPLHFWGAGIRDHYLVHYVYAGKGTLYVGAKKYEISANQMFFIFPGTIVKYVADEQEPWHYRWIAFVGDDAKEIFAEAGISIHNPVITLKDGSEIADAMSKIPRGEATAMSLRERLEFTAALYEFASRLVIKADDKRQPSYYAEALAFVRAHYFEELTVEQLADAVGISRKHLFYIFKKESGVSPKDCITAYRIEKAKQLLSDGRITVSSVAYSVGYQDAFNFSKMFKKNTGYSPEEYRKRTIKGLGR